MTKNKMVSASKHGAIPLRLGDTDKYGVRTQFGAVCWRATKRGAVEIALITSRGSGRWGIPKGWPMDGATPASAAAQEAYEEAGLEGKVEDLCIGIYTYEKSMERGTLPCVVAIFPLKVKKVRDTWPESNERTRKWLTPKRAADLVEFSELKRILLDFDPNLIGGR